MIDWSVRLGDLMVLGGFVGTCCIYAFKVGGFTQMINGMGEKITKLEQSLGIVASAITTLAVQKVQIERIEGDIKDMKRGVGWITDHGAKTVDREY